MTDNVNHPAHYAEGWSNGAEVIDITENLNFNLGNVVKYVSRAGRKSDDPREDLEKAQFYLQREIDRLNQEHRDYLAEMTGIRAWDLLDYVPPNTIVEDKDGDRYRRIVGTAKFEISMKETTHGQYYEWQQLWPFFYKEQSFYGPFTEVKE